MEEGQSHQNSDTTLPTVENEEPNLIDFMTKKEEKSREDVAMTDANAEGISDPTHKKEKHTLLEKLHNTHSNSSSSSDEEVEDGGENKKRKKKGFKDKIKQKLSGEKEKECNKHSENATENSIEVEIAEATNTEEKKGFLDKIKEKLPGHHKKTEGGAAVPCTNEDSPGGETKEKKGIMDKIMGKLPGHHNSEHGPKEKEN